MAAVLLLLVAAMAGAERAQALPETTDLDAWAVEGDIYDIARHGDTTYLGGDFKYVGPRTGSAVALAKSDASLQDFPEVAGDEVRVDAVEPDGSGGWYLGGNFTHVGGVPRRDLAHVMPDGSVDPAFNPGVNGSVTDIELSIDGEQLFVGGSFAVIGGVPTTDLAALSAANGTPVLGWDAQAPVLGSINDLAVHPNGTYLYVGGLFSSMGGDPRDNFAELLTSDGSATTACAGGINGTVSTVKLNATDVGADSKIFLGGSFTEAFGDPHESLARIDYDFPCTVDAWNPSVNGSVRDIALSGDESTVYVAGNFDTVDGATPRTDLAAFDDATGAHTAWNPSPGGNLNTFVSSVNTLHAEGSTIYAGGNFTSIGGQPRNGLAAIDAAGAATAWNANVGEVPQDIEVVGSTVLAGGNFSTAKGVRRSNVAALGASGAATSWNPGVGFNTTVRALAVAPDGQTIYIGGEFSGDPVGGQIRDYLAAVNASGTATDWNPSANSDVLSLALSPDGSTVYTGGSFSNVGGQPRNNAAAIDESGAVTPWNPQPSSDVNVVLPKPDGSGVLLGGDFSTVGGGTPRDHLVEVDTAGGTATAWTPDPNGEVYSLALSPDGGTVYLGGDLGNVGGEPRNYIGGVDATSGAATGFDPDADSIVHALAVSPDGSTVYAGGEFSGASAIGGAERPYLAELDATTGLATGWTPPAPDFDVFTLDYTGFDLLVGGDFDGLGSHAQRGFARFVGPRPPEPEPPSSSGPPEDTTPPELLGASTVRKVFAVGRRPTAVAAFDARAAARRGQRRRRWPVGTAFRWSLSETARTTIVVQRRQRGLRLGRRCVRPTRAVRRRVQRQLNRQVARLKGRRRARRLRQLRRRRICPRFQRRGALQRGGNAGQNRTYFSGRIGRRALPPGIYRAVFRAVDSAGNRSNRASTKLFRIVRQPPRRRSRTRR